jgi:hypothetical protein
VFRAKPEPGPDATYGTSWSQQLLELLCLMQAASVPFSILQSLIFQWQGQHHRDELTDTGSLTECTLTAYTSGRSHRWVRVPPESIRGVLSIPAVAEISSYPENSGRKSSAACMQQREWSVAPILQLLGGGCPAWHIGMTNPSNSFVGRDDF